MRNGKKIYWESRGKCWTIQLLYSDEDKDWICLFYLDEDILKKKK